jgi:hypothetical protein
MVPEKSVVITTARHRHGGLERTWSLTTMALILKLSFSLFRMVKALAVIKMPQSQLSCRIAPVLWSGGSFMKGKVPVGGISKRSRRRNGHASRAASHSVA